MIIFSPLFVSNCCVKIRSHFIVQADLELVIPLSQPPECIESRISLLFEKIFKR